MDAIFELSRSNKQFDQDLRPEVYDIVDGHVVHGEFKTITPFEGIAASHEQSLCWIHAPIRQRTKSGIYSRATGHPRGRPFKNKII